MRRIQAHDPRGNRARICFYSLLCGIWLNAGCSHLKSQVGTPPPPKPDQISVGHSQLSDVLRAEGIPSRLSVTAEGFAMLYEYNGITEKQLGFNLDLPVLRWFKMVGARSWLEHQSCLASFDTNGVLTGWGEEHWRAPLGRGGGVQILVTVSPLVDSTQLRRPAPQHEWGKSSLAPLPKVLNTGASLDSGLWGFEQTMAPTAVGQRALEMTPAPKKFPKKK